MNKIRRFRFPPKKIIVPLDVSDASLVGWKQAQNLAKIFGSEIQGLYVQQWLYYAMDEPYFRSIEMDKQAVLDSLRLKLGQGADVRPVDGSIEAWGLRPGLDLIVMGTDGRTWLESAVKGSVAEHLVRHCGVPVLAARRPVARFRRILAPVNFEPYAMEGLLFAAKAAQALRARLTVLHVCDSPVYADQDPLKGPKQLLADFIGRLPAPLRRACRPQPALAFGKPAAEIVAAADQADLVVLSAHRKGPLENALLGTTAERVLRHCRKPVLAVPVKNG